MTTLLNNRYQVIQVLGSGGFGETFLAEDMHMPSRRRCVIKQLKPVINNPQMYQVVQQRFEREAATLEYLGEASDQIPNLYAYFPENGQFYLIQEFIHGQTLTNIVETTRVLSEAVVREILVSLLTVLDYVHSKGIIHRDIKPDNIILRASDRKPVLIDFGAVKETMVSVVSQPGKLNQSMVIGTPGFMPSEQAVGQPVYATDIYSLGLTAIYLLTGRQPYELQTNAQTGEIQWQQFAPQVSPNLAAVLTQAIKPHASDRFSTASKILAALQSQTPIPTNPPKTQATVNLSPGAAVPRQPSQPRPAQTNAPVIPPPSSGSSWRKPLIFASAIAIGLLAAAVVTAITRKPQAEAPVATTPASEPITQSPPTAPEPADTPVAVATPEFPVISAPPRQQEPVTTIEETAPEVTSTPQLEENPAVTSQAPGTENILVEEQQPETQTAPAPAPVAPPPVRSVPETPRRQAPPVAINTNNVASVPAFPTGTFRSTVEATLGRPGKDLRGKYGNTRAVTYNVVPGQIDLGFLFDRETGAIRQTEAAFAQSVDLQVMKNTLNGLLSNQASADIKQGLQQVQQRQSDNFKFQAGSVKGQIVRQDCDFIYISIWDADLHDFVPLSQAQKCS